MPEPTLYRASREDFTYKLEKLSLLYFVLELTQLEVGTNFTYRLTNFVPTE
jgi:hypothetical protein